jgi:hypothetical protein
MTHGAQEPCFGVTVEDMKKIQKSVKIGRFQRIL